MSITRLRCDRCGYIEVFAWTVTQQVYCLACAPDTGTHLQYARMTVLENFPLPPLPSPVFGLWEGY